VRSRIFSHRCGPFPDWPFPLCLPPFLCTLGALFFFSELAESGDFLFFLAFRPLKTVPVVPFRSFFLPFLLSNLFFSVRHSFQAKKSSSASPAKDLQLAALYDLVFPPVLSPLIRLAPSENLLVVFLFSLPVAATKYSPPPFLFAPAASAHAIL